MGTRTGRKQPESTAKALREARAKKKPITYHELAPGWRVSADAVAWKLERCRGGESTTWALVGYCGNLSQVFALFANARIRAGAEDGAGILESVRQAAGELADLLAKIKDATLVLEAPKGTGR